MGLGDYLHSREERSQRPGPALLPAQNEEGRGVLGPASLVLGFRWKLHTPVYPGDREVGSVAGVGGGGGGSKMREATRKGKDPGFLK